MTVFKRSNTIRNSKHKVQGICDVATLAVKQSLTKTLLVCLGILIVGVWLLIQLVIVPFMAELKDLRAQTSHSLFERNREIMRSTVELGASNIQQLFAATEVAVNTMITDLHSPKVKMAKSPFLPTAQEYLTADAIKKSMSPHPLYPDRLVSLEYPRVYYPSDEMSDARALEEKNLQGYWPSFEKTVSSLHSLTGEFKWLYVASETGMLLVYPGSDNVPKGYDPRVRPWYVGAMGRQAGYWTPPYYTAGGNEIVITFSQPLGQHAFMKNAVVAADLVLTDIINKVLFTPLCDECKIYLVNERDEIIAQREPATLKASWTEPLPVKTLGEVLASRADVVGEGNDGQHNIFSVSIDRLHWRLVGVIYNHSLGNDGGQIIARISSFSQKNKTALMIIMGVVLAIVLILMGTLYLIVRRTMRTKMEPSLDQFKRLAQNLDAVHLDNVLSLMAGDATNVTESLTHEHKIVVEALQRLGDKLLNAEKQIETKSKLAAVGETAGQVAHDIRSPLTALSVIAAELGELAEEKRLLIRSAVQRIEDIANDLSSKRVQRPKTNDQSQKQGEIVIPAKAGIQNITPTVDPSLRWDDKTNPTLKGTSDTLSLPPLATNSHLLSAVVESLVSEKRTQYRNRSGVTIEANLGSESYGLFANIQLDQFKRVLSNIVNNAVEAMEGGGSLVVAMRAVEPQSHRAYDSEFTEAPTPHGSMAQDIQITIIDTGKGIPAEILPRLFRCGESFGKIDGAGLGLYLARENVRAWGGDIAIESKEGRGTAVTITLPREKEPDWFLPEIRVHEGVRFKAQGAGIKSIVILDDDESIHHVWENRFVNEGTPKESIVHFKDPERLVAWYKEEGVRLNPSTRSGQGARGVGHMEVGRLSSLRKQGSRIAENMDPSFRWDDKSIRDTLFLFDYELIGSAKTGLDVIEELGIGGQAILVTSHYEEEQIRSRCANVGVKLLPKNLAGVVPIRVDRLCPRGYGSSIACAPEGMNRKLQNTIPPDIIDNPKHCVNNRRFTIHDPYPLGHKRSTIDAILIDDEALNRDTWRMVGRTQGKNVTVFETANEFFECMNDFDRSVPIYIDSDLGCGVRGEEVAKEIYQEGFEQIFLTTGSSKNAFPPMSWIKAIVDKLPPYVEGV